MNEAGANAIRTCITDSFHFVDVVPVDDRVERCIDAIEKFHDVDRFTLTGNCGESDNIAVQIREKISELEREWGGCYLK